MKILYMFENPCGANSHIANEILYFFAKSMRAETGLMHDLIINFAWPKIKP